MKIKNLKCYLLGAIILANSSFTVSCTLVEEKYDRVRNKDFYEFLENNDIVAIKDLHNIPRNYYEAEVSEHRVVGDEVIIDSHYERLDRIDNVICQAIEYDYDYKILKIEKDEDSYQITSKTFDNIDFREEGYDYVYKDNYLINTGSRKVLLKYGKVLERK